jgi:hypothetical protein
MTSFSVQLATEMVEEGNGTFGCNTFALNHEFSIVLFNEVTEQSIGNHNFELVSAQKSFQYGAQSFALEVEPASDVSDDFRMLYYALNYGKFQLSANCFAPSSTFYISEFSK